jgi:hypothetical protein
VVFVLPQGHEISNWDAHQSGHQGGILEGHGKDREIFKPVSACDGGHRELVGMKKMLVFYMGRAPRGSKTNCGSCMSSASTTSLGTMQTCALVPMYEEFFIFCCPLTYSSVEFFSIYSWRGLDAD